MTKEITILFTKNKANIFAVVCATWLCFLSVICLILLNGTDVTTNIGANIFEPVTQVGYRQSIFIIIFLYIFSGGIFAFFINSFTIWLQSAVVGLASFLYYTTVKKAILGVFELNLPIVNYFILPRIVVIHTGYVVIPLLVLLFLVNHNLFGQNKLKRPLLLLQNLLFAVLCFSFLELIKSDRTIVRNFSSGTLSFIGNINPNIWVLVCTFMISMLSILRLKLIGLRKNLGFIFLLFFILSQFLLLLSPTKDFPLVIFGSFTYWHKSLFLIIFWSFVFYPISLISDTLLVDKFRDKFILSAIYHFIILTIALGLVLY